MITSSAPELSIGASRNDVVNVYRLQQLHETEMHLRKELEERKTIYKNYRRYANVLHTVACGLLTITSPLVFSRLSRKADKHDRIHHSAETVFLTMSQITTNWKAVEVGLMSKGEYQHLVDEGC